MKKLYVAPASIVARMSPVHVMAGVQKEGPGLPHTRGPAICAPPLPPLPPLTVTIKCCQSEKIRPGSGYPIMDVHHTAAVGNELIIELRDSIGTQCTRTSRGLADSRR
jgi:hypothetical protein